MSKKYLSGGPVTGCTMRICGQMSPDSIPVSAAIDLAAMKEGDPDPLEVVVEIEFGEANPAKDGTIFQRSFFEEFCASIDKRPLGGGEGHIDPATINFAKRHFGTYWVGYQLDADRAYFRGYVDRDETKLKRDIRAGLIQEVSVYGKIRFQKVDKAWHAVGCPEPWSLDWTDPGRQGMKTRLVATGQMELFEEDKRGLIEKAVRAKYGTDTWVYIEATAESYIIIRESDGGKWYKLDYRVENGAAILGEAQEVERVVSYIPAAPAGKEQEVELKDVTNDELLAELNARKSTGRIAVEAVAGQMGIAVLDPTVKTKAEKLEAIEKIAGQVDPVAFVDGLVKDREGQVKKEFEALRGQMINEAFPEPVRALASDLFRLETGTKEEITGEINRIKELPSVKALASQAAARPGVVGTVVTPNSTAPETVII